MYANLYNACVMHKASHLSRSRSCALVLSGDMLENTSLVLLTICVSYISTEHTILTNGWIPITRDQVYNQINKKWTHNFIPTTLKPTTDTIHSYLKSVQKKANEITLENHLNIVDDINQNSDITPDNNDQIEIIEKLKTVTESSRKAKNIANVNLKKKIDFEENIHVNKKDVSKPKESEVKVTPINDRSNTYEVTEDISQDVEDFAEGSGYDYAPPITEFKNLTSKFMNILSKYNIKTDDKLPNYDLSRRIRNQNPMMNFQKLFPYRYNSPNHLPVDPLLAVFLSNYGVYLPSLYGIKSNYNNLYGYLASNNIHNNRPFGLYKIFSDTDSWN